MDKLKLHSPNITDENIDNIAQLFPNCVTEVEAVHNGERIIKKAIDFDLLRQELSASIVEGQQERYQLNWPGKREALLAANAPIAKTLRPNREESVDFDATENLFIEGDNLEALKLLQETYLGKVKMIYIDPPYNTGNDFIYDDDFAEGAEEYFLSSEQKDREGNRLVANTESNGRFHSDWLSMMYSRLKLARNLLADDGVILINMDENEIINLHKILEDIFGINNDLGTIVWDKRNPKGDSKGVAYQHEYIVSYAKNKSFFLNVNELVRPKKNAQKILDKAKNLFEKISDNYSLHDVNKDFAKWLNQQIDFSGGEKAYKKIDSKGRVYRGVSMAWPNKKKAPADYFIPLIHPKTKLACPIPERGWRNPSSTMKKLLEEDLILFGNDERKQPERKYLLEENMYENLPSLLYFGGSDTELLEELQLPFDTPKVTSICVEHIKCFSEKDAVVLDFFAGSSTTAHAVMQLNAEDGGKRKFIMVQLDEKCDEKSEAFKAGYKTIADISKERIRRAGKKIKTENPDKADNLDVGFRVLKVASSNMHDVYYNPDTVTQKLLFDTVDNIKGDRTEEDLLFQVLLDWGVDLTLPITKEKVCGQDVFFVDSDALAACFVGGGKITDELCRELAGRHPLRAVFRDGGFKDDSVKINAEQIFKQLSPNTDIKVI